MTLFKSFAIFLTLTFLSGCTSTKNANHSSAVELKKENELKEQKFLQEGYSKGIIIYSDIKNDCEYTIRVESSGSLFDPINLENTFKQDGAKIWFTFRPLRMMNRCDKANPIEIEAIQLRM